MITDDPRTIALAIGLAIGAGWGAEQHAGVVAGVVAALAGGLAAVFRQPVGQPERRFTVGNRVQHVPCRPSDHRD